MPRLLIALLALALGGASSFLAACGDRNGLLPATKANAMISDLNSVSDAIGSGDCATAQRAVSRAKSVLHSATTSRHTLTDRVRLELDHLAAVASTECQSRATTSTATTTTATTPTTASQTTATTPTTTTTTTTPSTQSTDTTSTSSTTDSTTPSADTGQTNGGAAPGGDGGGHGHGHGNGNGGGASGGG